MRDTLRWSSYHSFECAKITHLENADFPEPALVGLAVDTGYLDLLVDLKSTSEVFVVVFQGAVDRCIAPHLPNFTAVNLLQKFAVSKLFISDPSLYLDNNLRIGWYIGSRNFDARSVINTVIEIFLKKTSAKKLIFLGGSGGGYAALWTGSFFRNSLSIVWNPQTDIMKHARKDLEHFSRACFGVQPEDLPALINTSVVEKYKFGQSNYVLYLQNSRDWHVIGHMNPFLSSLGLSINAVECGAKLSEKFYLYLSSKWGEGHRAPPESFLEKILKIATSCESNEDIFNKSRFAI